jgi:glyoxylase-like metal-dependent hydrolase (beta-lactamase superfamily II)
MESWQIGQVKITRIVELELAGGTRFVLPDATRDACLPIRWLAPHFMDDRGNLIMSIHALIVETPSFRIVVDTCLGNDKKRDIPIWNLRQGPFLDDLRSAGYPPESIDRVLCTHLHVDHVGWNTKLVDGRWVPTFPNARYLIGRVEWEHWDDATADPYRQVIDDSVRPIVDAGLVDLVDMDEQICDEVRLEPTPGHTPGHVSVRISSGGEEALITGDFLHHPCQMARPDWCSPADSDSEHAQRTRLAALDRVAGTPTLVIGTHFASPTAGKVVRDGDVYRFEV